MSSVTFSIAGNAALSKPCVRNLGGSSTAKASTIKHEISAPPKQVVLRLNQTPASSTSNLGRREAIGLGFLAGLRISHLSLYREPSAAAEAAASPCELAVAPSGLAFCDRVVGTGPEAVKGQLIKAHYVGKLENGKIFDSSYDRGKPLTFRVGVGETKHDLEQIKKRKPITRATCSVYMTLEVAFTRWSEELEGSIEIYGIPFKVEATQVIKGWDEGILGGEGIPPMQAGGKRTLKLPPELGYGMRGAGCRGGSCIIPPDSVLLFDVELLK